MEHHVEWFQFTLPSYQTIGPDALRLIWMQACGSSNISVQRNSRVVQGCRMPIYSLRASPRLTSLSLVEARLRSLMQAARLDSTLTLVLR